MLDHRHYVPALKWRMGEYEALKELSASQKAEMTPLVEVPALPWDYPSGKPAKTIDQHLSRMPTQFAKSWGTELPIFVDLGPVQDAGELSDGRHPVDHLFQALASSGVRAVPVTAPERELRFQDAIASVVAASGLGCAVRVGLEDAFSPEVTATLDDTRSRLGVGRGEIDLIIDLGAIEPPQSNLLRVSVTGLLATLNAVDEYRTVTLLCGAFPPNLSAFNPGLGVIPRTDWTLWQSVRAASPRRLPFYGDYTTTHPEVEDIDPRVMRVSASIRYATDDEWLIFRGRNVRDPRHGGFAQFRTLSQHARAHPLFSGAGFSWADDFILSCADNGPTGSLTTWRKVATNRHLAVVLHQLASLSSP